MVWAPSAILAFFLAAGVASNRFSDTSRRTLAPHPYSPQEQNSNVEKRAEAPQYSFKELFDLQKQLLDNFVAPNNAKQAASINSSLLASNVQGRVDVTRTFDGAELNTEYLFGLFANLIGSQNDPEAYTLLGVPEKYEITHFAASGNIASASTRFSFNFPALNITLPVQIETWNAFDDKRQISMYDATFPWWQWTVDTLLSVAANALHTNLSGAVAVATTKLSTSICHVAATYCNATNTPNPEDRYESKAQCLHTLTSEKRFGEAYELGRDTLLCRMVHQGMVPFRPEVHCPHIGPKGGGKCVDDKDYADVVSQDYFSNFDFASGGVLTGP